MVLVYRSEKPDRRAGRRRASAAYRRRRSPRYARRPGAGTVSDRDHASRTALFERAGTVTAATVTVRSRGRSTHRPALSGSVVAGQRAGDLLAQIDPSQFKVAPHRLRDKLAKDNAMLANARRDLGALSATGKNHPFPRQELDAQQALVNETRGNH